ncbi:unnamed protein product [Bursaphelenchus okinawaensis]|uniref:Protein kinase domain-containing protein n=1 Tax=Bursaphelenchus okinawaensis TaxID=465554 RepID=A0A811KGN7_9BILA|nr:unnamed protein product [Bursaphelenchus okinawaensis]CAG9101904.1 unnamed protein product [Bursaphelenchus okinawaensis]
MLVTYYLFILFLLIPSCDGKSVNMGEVVLKYYKDCLHKYVSKYFTGIAVFTLEEDGGYYEYNVNLTEETVSKKRKGSYNIKGHALFFIVADASLSRKILAKTSGSHFIAYNTETMEKLKAPKELAPGYMIVLHNRTDFIDFEKKKVYHHDFENNEFTTTKFRGSVDYTYTLRPDDNLLYAYKEDKCFKAEFFNKKDPYAMTNKKPCGKKFKIIKDNIAFDLSFLTYLTRSCTDLWYIRPPYAVTYVLFKGKHQEELDHFGRNVTFYSLLFALLILAILCIVGSTICILKWRGRNKEKADKERTEKKEKSTDTVSKKKKKTVKKGATRTDTDNQESSSMPASNANDDSNVTIQDLLENEVLRSNLFALNEVENLEAEIPNIPMTGKPQPTSGMYTQFKEVGVTIPAGTFQAMFGQYDFVMGATPSTLFYEYESCGMNRIEAMAAVMVEAERKGKYERIPKLKGTKNVKEGINVRLLVTDRLGTSIEGDCKSGKLEFEEKIDIFYQTLQCLEDLQIAHIVHRDVKPAAFRYHLDGPKIYLTLLGLARVKQYENRERVPFFGNMTFCCPNAHLKKERTFADDLISWFYMVCWTIDKRLLGWIGVVDKRSIYQNKVDMFTTTFFNPLVDKMVTKPIENKFLKELQLAVALQTKEIYVEYPKVFAVIVSYKSDATKPSTGGTATTA